MKKILFIILILIGLCHINGTAQEVKIMLKHEGNATFFEKNQLDKAITAAVNGDTILLTEGEFTSSGNITVDKRISIIGAGQTTIIPTNIDINVKGEQTTHSITLEGLKVKGNIKSISREENLTLRKVNFNGIETNSVGLKNVLFDRCCITGYIYASEDMNGTIINSYVEEIRYNSKNLCFVNSFIKTINGTSGSTFAGTALNTIIRKQSATSGVKDSAILKNCIIGEAIDISKAITENCHLVNGSQIDNLDRTNTQSMIEKGYVGNDGTAIGEYGGNTPYTLEPSGPVITSIEVKVDPASNSLKVTATGKAN